MSNEENKVNGDTKALPIADEAAKAVEGPGVTQLGDVRMDDGPLPRRDPLVQEGLKGLGRGRQYLHDNIEEPAGFKEPWEPRAYPGVPPLPPGFTAGHVDISSYMRAQHDFIEAQNRFLLSRNSENYIEEVTTFSHAQRIFIEAQAAMLKQLGVI